MGKINKGILGGFNGKVGTVVGFAWLLLKLLFVQNRDLSAFHFDGAFGNGNRESASAGILWKIRCRVAVTILNLQPIVVIWRSGVTFKLDSSPCLTAGR